MYKLSDVLALCILFAISSSWLTATVVGQSTIEKARNRTVYIDDGDGQCTGVVLETNLVLTCGHCIEEGHTPKVNGKVGHVLKKDEKVDLALISVDTVVVHRLKFVDAHAGDDVFSWGFPLQSPNVAFSRGYVNVVQFDMVYSTVQSLPGSSGSGVYNHNGQLVALTVGYMPKGGMAVSIPAQTIREFLK